LIKEIPFEKIFYNSVNEGLHPAEISPWDEGLRDSATGVENLQKQ
jgi:hypothetical protein